MRLFYGGVLLLSSVKNKAQTSEVIEIGEKLGSSDSATILGIVVAVLFSLLFFLAKYFFSEADKRNTEFKEVLQDAKDEIKRLQGDYKALEINHQETLKDHSKQIQKINKDHSEKFEKLFNDYRGIINDFNKSLHDLIVVVEKQNNKENEDN